MSTTFSKPREPVLEIENARILFRNFAGRPTPMNPEGGKRSFCVVLEPELAEKLERDGWNVKRKAPLDEGDPELIFVQVAVVFNKRPPRIVMITSRGRTTLNEDRCENLDHADILEVDLTINPSRWGDGSRVKAYLRSMYVRIREDRLELKYADIPDANDRRAVDPDNNWPVEEDD